MFELTKEEKRVIAVGFFRDVIDEYRKADYLDDATKNRCIEQIEALLEQAKRGELEI